MKSDIRSRSQAARRMVLLAGLFCFSLFLPVYASAALGGNVTSVEADQQHMKAKRAVQSNAHYSVHEITTTYGTVVREFVSPSGVVFGVAWHGPFLPDFSQILGSYYAKFAQATQELRATKTRNARKAFVSVEQADLIMHSAGHTHNYAGMAYVPGMIPPGVNAQEIR